MKFEVNPGLDAQPMEAPTATVDVPEGFLRALRWARRFVGTHEMSFPAGTFVHIAGDKLYATNNHHLVELEVGSDLGSARLSGRDIAVLTSIGEEPNKLRISDTEVTFTWSDGRWVTFQTEPVAFDWPAEFRKRIDAYWTERQPTVSPDPKSVNLLVDRSRKEPTAFNLPQGESGRLGRVVVFPSGVFFRKGKSSISDLIGDGNFDPRLDDVFAEAIKETKVAQEAKAKQVERLISRIDAIQRQIENLTAESEALDQKLRDQHTAVAKYQSGDDLDDTERAILTPRCEQLSSQNRRDEVEREFDRHVDAIPEGWEVTDKRLKDDFIYITIRRERVTRKTPDDAALKKIQKAVSRLFTPTFDRAIRARQDRLGTLSPINPGAG